MGPRIWVCFHIRNITVNAGDISQYCNTIFVVSLEALFLNGFTSCGLVPRCRLSRLPPQMECCEDLQSFALGPALAGFLEHSNEFCSSIEGNGWPKSMWGEQTSSKGFLCQLRRRE